MQDATLPTASRVRRQLLGASLSLSAGATLLIGLYLAALLRLPGEQWRGFGLVVVALFPVLFGLQDRVGRWLWAPLGRCLERVHAGTAEPEDLRRGFASAVNLPTRGQRIGPLWWVVGGVLVAAVMKLRYETFTWLSTAVVVAAAVSGGYVMAVFHFFVVKRVLAPVRAALAEALPDPVERASLVEGTTLRSKLRFSITGVTVFTVMFAIFCAHVRSMRPVEAHASRIQSRFLEQVVERLDWDGTVALRFAREEAQRLGIADELLLLDPADLAVVAGRPEALPPGERRLIVETGEERGDSTLFDSPQVLTWRHLPDEGLVLVAVSRWEPLMGEVRGTQGVFVVLLLGATGIALALAWLLSDDVSGATAALGHEVERLSRGDLRRGRSFESEDELGVLSRAFEAMGDSLRGLVGRTALAADRVEVTAGAMAEVASDVSALTADQVSGIEQTSGSMEAISDQVRGIADSAQVLNASVEESSSSVLELGAAGEELNDTANVLSERVNEVSGSIEQMVGSVKQVMANTEALAEAAVETSSSMSEMAASMREVDAAAEQTARLSEQVVETAESGQQKTDQVIAGMEAIRESADTAERVIRSLGNRASEIGAIVDVIDDVADETSLLALNAAIIAAQAGEQGRAFSVVADEIKDLADRTLASTREIGGLIRAVQDESANAIGAVERGSRSVASGVGLSAEAGVALEEITEASRASGQRTAEIVQAVREQARAARHVVELTERVRGGVEEIAAAAREQDRGNEVVHAGAVVMRDVASQVRGTTEDQARGSRRIRESVEGVREAMEQINEALQEQSTACRSAVEFLDAMHQRTRIGETSASRLDGVAKELIEQAETLRRELGRFRI